MIFVETYVTAMNDSHIAFRVEFSEKRFSWSDVNERGNALLILDKSQNVIYSHYYFREGFYREKLFEEEAVNEAKEIARAVFGR